MLLLAVSLWAAPYAWFTDEILFAPALLRGIYLSGDHNGRMAAFAFFDAVALILLACNLTLHSGAFIWTSTAWLAWYVWSARLTPATVSHDPSPAYSEA
jgi:hypothetical protein